MLKLIKFWGRLGLVCLLAGLVALVAGCTYQQVVDYIVPPPKKVSQQKVEVLPPENSTEVTQEQSQGSEKYNLVLFFGDQEGSLVAEKRQIPKVEGLARRAINELIKGPKSDKLKSNMPTGTKLLDINIKPDGLCIVNFSKELMTNHQGGSSGETNTVYSIVNTLTQFSSVEEVQILIEGEQKETLAGHLDISQPLERDATMVSGN